MGTLTYRIPADVTVEDAESDVLREAMEHAVLVFELQVRATATKHWSFIAKIDSDETVPLPPLIILDLNLPKVSGGKLLARVRVSWRCCPVPVVLTSSDSPKDKAKIAQFAAT